MKFTETVNLGEAKSTLRSVWVSVEWIWVNSGLVWVSSGQLGTSQAYSGPASIFSGCGSTWGHGSGQKRVNLGERVWVGSAFGRI